MTRSVVLPFFANAPKDYSKAYLDSIVTSFAIYMRQIQSPGDGRNTSLVLTGLQRNDARLEVGSLFQVDGVVRVAMADRSYVEGVSGAMGMGVVTTVP